MEIFIAWFIFSILAGAFAASRGRSGFGFFLLALLLSPLIAFIIILIAQKKPTSAARAAAEVEAANSKKCPFCAETIKVEAVVCRFCGRDQPVPAARTLDTRSDDQKFEEWLANQKPPLKLASLSAEERREQRKAFDWASRGPQSEPKSQLFYVGMALLGAVGLMVVAIVLS